MQARFGCIFGRDVIFLFASGVRDVFVCKNQHSSFTHSKEKVEAYSFLTRNLRDNKRKSLRKSTF